MQAEYSVSTTVTSTSYTDTGLSLSITPTSATSKILVLINQQYELFASAADVGYGLQIVRTSTSIFDQDAVNAANAYGQGLGEIAQSGVTSLSYLDSPATTAATTYKTQGKLASTANSRRVKFQANAGAKSTITLLEIGA